uniref:site-specific DNA-methyltransferase (adenine-specific) n=1 Tax=Candidatus Endomicrobium sp. MdDo-005 TaxID=1837115 RepID=A0A1C9ZTN1_9BACT|nr:modification methylase [Candidatus Endomicrobium sp. MdDo-005]
MVELMRNKGVFFNECLQISLPMTISENRRKNMGFRGMSKRLVGKERDIRVRKSIFLNSLKNSGNGARYKRYLGSPLRYPGGKSLAVGLIVELIPDGVKKLVSPFFGGGSVEIACSRELEIKVIGYDIFDILVNYWQMQIDNPPELCKKLSEIRPTKENYLKIKEILKKYWNEEIILNNLELAAFYFFNYNLSYGPGFLGWMSSIYQDEKKYKTTLDRVKNFAPKNLNVFCDIFGNVIPRHKNDFLYCDPPYFLEGDSKMFKGIYPQRNFPVHHKGFDHNLLCDLLKKHRGGFILSYNDCSDIRRMYKDYKIVDVQWQYTLGQGEKRIGKNRIKNGTNSNIKKSHEILILGV